jgi:hypothetical protein
MNKLNTGSKAFVALAVIAAHSGRRQSHHRAKAFATSGNEITGKLRNERNRAIHQVDDQRINVFDVIRSKVNERIQ